MHPRRLPSKLKNNPLLCGIISIPRYVRRVVTRHCARLRSMSSRPGGALAIYYLEQSVTREFLFEICSNRGCLPFDLVVDRRSNRRQARSIARRAKENMKTHYFQR